jgi:hypothetical protein
MITLERLKKIFDEVFDHPFLPKGFVEAKLVTPLENGTKVLNIRIGDRDISFDEKGLSTGQGTNVGDAVEWEIFKKKKEEKISIRGEDHIKRRGGFRK